MLQLITVTSGCFVVLNAFGPSGLLVGECAPLPVFCWVGEAGTPQPPQGVGSVLSGIAHHATNLHVMLSNFLEPSELFLGAILILRPCSLEISMSLV